MHFQSSKANSRSAQTETLQRASSPSLRPHSFIVDEQWDKLVSAERQNQDEHECELNRFSLGKVPLLRTELCLTSESVEILWGGVQQGFILTICLLQCSCDRQVTSLHYISSLWHNQSQNPSITPSADSYRSPTTGQTCHSNFHLAGLRLECIKDWMDLVVE